MILLVPISVVLSVVHGHNGFLTDFFQRFPHLPFAQLHPQSNHDAYYKTLDYMLSKRELALPLATTTTTTTRKTTTTLAPKTTGAPLGTSPYSALLASNDEIWFGSTPTPLYRGYVTKALEIKTNPPSLKFEDSKFGYNKKFKPPTTTVTKPSSKGYAIIGKKGYPFDKFDSELEEPAYMTDPNNFALPEPPTDQSIEEELDYEFKINPYSQLSHSTVKPHELKSLEALPDPRDVKSLKTTTALPTYPPRSYPPAATYKPPPIHASLYQNYAIKDVEPFSSYETFEINKVNMGFTDHFEELAHKARKDPSELAFGFFDIEPEQILNAEKDDHEEEEEPIRIDDPYAAKHHHFNHQPKYVTHIPLKYPIDPYHDEFFGHSAGSDKILDHISSINDPWLPQGGEIPRAEHVDSGLSMNDDDYELFFDKENNDYSYYDYDSSYYDSNETNSSEFGLPGSFEDNFKDSEEEFHIPDSFISTTTPEPPFFAGKFVPSIEATTKTPPPAPPTFRKRIKPFSKLVSTKLPKISVTPKGSPAAMKSTKGPFSLSTIFTTTLKPLLVKPKKPTPAAALKIPSLGQMASGYKSFMNEQGEKVSDFINGLFTSSKGTSSFIAKRQGERSPDVTLRTESKATAHPSQLQYSSFVKKFSDVLSPGGRNELSPLEQVKVLLKEARDKPLLK